MVITPSSSEGSLILIWVVKATDGNRLSSVFISEGRPQINVPLYFYLISHEANQKPIICDGILMELFLDVVKNGAEAMDWNGQDPPRSYGDLEGAWWVWKKGGSASPLIDGEDED